MSAASFSDFKPVTGHSDYLIRDLGDNGTGDGAWVELCRADGWGFGAMKIDDVEAVVDADEADPIPPTGRTLAAIFGEDPEPEVVEDPSE